MMRMRIEFGARDRTFAAENEAPEAYAASVADESARRCGATLEPFVHPVFERLTPPPEMD
jgi:hypothetical protein